jgi:asparagine synthetase B (glutamine-hydrolysing)
VAAITDSNDYRVTAQLHQAGQAGKAAAALSSHQVEAEAHQRLGSRVMVSGDGGDELFLYTDTQDAATAAQQSVTDLLGSHGMTADFTVERWHPVEEEWEPAGQPLPETEAAIEAEQRRLDAEETRESLAGGVALYEVRVQLRSHHEALALAARLKSEGYTVVRRWRFLVVGANNGDQAAEFEAAIRPEAPAGATVTTVEVGPRAPFTVFEVAAGTGL